MNLSDCKPTEQLAKVISAQEREFGNYSEGRFGLIANKFKLFKHPIPYKGEQGFFEVPDELLRSAS